MILVIDSVLSSKSLTAVINTKIIFIFSTRDFNQTVNFTIDR